ncbi:MAG: reverse transcriptase family protein, partial [Oscillospiraceae bacterium]
RSLKVGDLVLLLLPLETNKLELKWQGPFPVTRKVSLYDYQIKTKSGKLKVFHINMLKLYNVRTQESDADDAPLCAAIASVLTHENNEEELLVQDSDAFVHYNVKQKESYTDVLINPDLSRTQSSDLKKLIFEFQDIFSDVPKITNLIKHKIVLKSDDVVQCKPYPVPIHLREKLDKEVDDMLEAGIISPSTGPFASPIVIIMKPDKSIRLCVNYKQLNSISQFDPEPMVLIDDIFDKLGGSHFFSTCDMAKGYYQCALEEESKKYTTFCHPYKGLFSFESVPFGLSSAPATFTRMMRKLLNGTENLEFYLDDVITHTETWNVHMKALRVFFTRVRDANISLRPIKCRFGFSSVKFLGHLVDEDSKLPNPENLQKILEASRPETKKQIKSLLGSCGFYQQYIPKYSEMVAPLTDCLRKLKPNKIDWGSREETSFQEIKRVFLSPLVLKLVCLDKEFVIRSDASDVGIAAVLLQETDGILHPVCFASKKLSDREKLYCISEREAMASVWGILKFHKYLYGREFTLETDHKPCSILKLNDSSSVRLQRWSMLLQQYQFKIKYIPGDTCLISDFLSRHFK